MNVECCFTIPVFLTCLAPLAAGADEPDEFKPIDPEIVTAWEKAGLEYGRFKIGDSGTALIFERIDEAKGPGLPGFEYSRRGDRVNLEGLPAPKVPFGFSAGPAQTDDQSLRPLANFTTLELVSLTGRPIGDAGVRHLAELKQLRWVGLDGTQITDSGLKHLSNLSKLIDLDLTFTRIDGSGLRGPIKMTPNAGFSGNFGLSRSL